MKPRAPRPSAGSRLITLIGVGLVLSGLAVLAYIAWQYFGTNVVAKREHEALRTEIAELWDPDSEVAPSGEDDSQVETTADFGNIVGLVRIPRFGAEYNMPVLTGFDDATLARSVGHYPDGAMPGEVGNFVLAGHRVTHGEPFRGFMELRAGDQVIVETKDEIFTYVLRGDGNDIEVDFRTSWPLAPVPDPDNPGAEPTERLLTLVTCSELFHTDARSVVVGELVGVETKTPS